jgi:epoxyqueuosine reductase
LLLPGAGSWFVLGSVITNADLGTVEGPIPEGCGNCRRCIDSCPTGAIVADGVIDARKCLAWLVQKPGEFPREYRIALGDRLYGCDDCQDSCPITIRLGPRLPGTAKVSPGPDTFAAGVDVLEVLEADDASIMSKFGRWYIPERNPTWVRRNALIILGNVAPIPVSRRTAAVLEDYTRSDDAWLRAHALWSAHRLGLDDIVARLGSDANEVVRSELESLGRVPRRPEVAAATRDPR